MPVTGVPAVARRSGLLTVDVWSDVMCPFCYLGAESLVRAVDLFEHADAVRIRHRSYQLLPDLAVDKTTSIEHHLVRDRGLPLQQARSSLAQLQTRGAQLGLDFRFDRVRVTNTRAAHRLIHIAEQQGRQHKAVRRLFRAYFTDGLNVTDQSVLGDLAEEIGLDRAVTIDALERGAFDEAVTADIRQAHEMGLAGTPFMVLADRYALSGAQPSETVLRALRTAWAEAERHPSSDR